MLGWETMWNKRPYSCFPNNVRQIFCFQFIIILLSHSDSKDSHFWESQWGNDLWLSHGSMHSAGVSIMTNVFDGRLLPSCDANGHFVGLVCSHNDIPFIIVNVYRYNTKHEIDKLIESIDRYVCQWPSKFPNSILLIGGDFNIDNALDRLSSGGPNNLNAKLLRLMDKFGLIDIWREKFPSNRSYTRSNKTGSRQMFGSYQIL